MWNNRNFIIWAVMHHENDRMSTHIDNLERTGDIYPTPTVNKRYLGYKLKSI
jgi:hypothetical protein